MADNDIVRRGYLNVVRNPQGGVLGRVQSVASKRQWVVLRRPSGGKPSRVELFRTEEQSGEPLKTFNIIYPSLRNVETVEAKKAFTMNMQDDSCLFLCTSRADMDDWYRDIQNFNTGQRGSSASFTNTNTAGAIYEFIPDDETFRVRLRKAKTLAFSGQCLLEILRDFERNLFHIALFTEEELPHLIVKWQIDHIRQYGSNNMAFKFESGSKSSTGVDWFIVDTEPGCAIRVHRAVDYWAKHIVEQVKNIPGRRSTLPSSPGVPDKKVHATKSLPSTGRSGLSAPPDNTYMSIDEKSRTPATVYAAPEPGKSKSGGGRVNKPPAQPPSNSSSNSTYMALNPNSMDSNKNQTYEGIGPRNQSSMNGDNSNPNSQLYMGIDPRTRNPTEGGQYMGLNEARSN